MRSLIVEWCEKQKKNCKKKGGIKGGIKLTGVGGPPQELAKRANCEAKQRTPNSTPIRPHPYSTARLPSRSISIQPPPASARGHGREQEEEVGGLGGGGRHLRRPHARHARHPAGRSLPRLRGPAHPFLR